MNFATETDLRSLVVPVLPALRSVRILQPVAGFRCLQLCACASQHATGTICRAVLALSSSCLRTGGIRTVHQSLLRVTPSTMRRPATMLAICGILLAAEGAVISQSPQAAIHGGPHRELKPHPTHTSNPHTRGAGGGFVIPNCTSVAPPPGDMCWDAKGTHIA